MHIPPQNSIEIIRQLYPDILRILRTFDKHILKAKDIAESVDFDKSIFQQFIAHEHSTDVKSLIQAFVTIITSEETIDFSNRLRTAYETDSFDALGMDTLKLIRYIITYFLKYITIFNFSELPKCMDAWHGLTNCNFQLLYSKIKDVTCLINHCFIEYEDSMRQIP